MYQNDPLPEALQWSEGMLLTPQHFQQSDIYWERRLRHLMAQLQPHYWGLLDLALDRAALAEGRVVIERLECVLPDGLVVQYPMAGQAGVLALDVSAEPALEQGRSLPVSLVVPVRAPGAASQTSAVQRFDSVAGGMALDENTGDEQVPMSRLRPRLALLAGEDIPAKYVAMPLMRISRDVRGEFKLDDFHPPLLRVGASAFLEDRSLQQQLLDLLARIRAKARELAGHTEGEGGEAGLRGLPEQRDAIHHLTAGLPPLDILANNASTHPFDLYLALAQVVGQAAAVATNPMPMQMSSYRHQDLMPGFATAMERLRRLLDNVQVGYELLAMEQVADGVFECQLSAEWPADGLLLETRGGSADEMFDWLRHARIASDELHPLLERRRLPGGELTRVSPEKVACLPLREGSAVVRLGNPTVEQDDGSAVHVIRSGQRLRVAGPGHGRMPQAMVLYRLRAGSEPVMTSARDMA